jgi:hypothetical protein
LRAPRYGQRQLWTAMPSSIVPYIVMLPDPADEPGPPIAQALHRTAATTMEKRIFMTASIEGRLFDSSLAAGPHTDR